MLPGSFYISFLAFYFFSCSVSQFFIIFLDNFSPNYIFDAISPFICSSFSYCCLLTCRSLSWLCLSRMRTRSCSSSTVPWSRSFSSIMALRRCSSSRFLSVSILICRGMRAGVGPHAFQEVQRREITFPWEKWNRKNQKVCMHVYRTCVCERKCISVCGLTLRKDLNGYSFPTLQRQFQRVSLCIGRPRSWQKCPKG